MGLPPPGTVAATSDVPDTRRMDNGTNTAVLAETLASRLRELRAEKDVTQAEAAAEAGMSRAHYALLESAQAASGGAANPRLSTLTALAQVYSVSVVDLLT
jgi:DNA-binding XRE family transcriptional regulator